MQTNTAGAKVPSYLSVQVFHRDRCVILRAHSECITDIQPKLTNHMRDLACYHKRTDLSGMLTHVAAAFFSKPSRCASVQGNALRLYTTCRICTARKHTHAPSAKGSIII
eukprot:346514-Amphidinium_carterae.1